MTQTQAKAPPAPPPPAIPGLEQGTPQASNRQGPPPATAGQTTPGQPVITTGPGRQETVQEIRDRIRDEINAARSEGRDPNINFGPVDFSNAVPRGAVIIAVMLFASIAFTLVFGPIARAYARRMDSQNQRQMSGGDLAPQIEQLQQSVDAMAMELERITEAQRFQSKLLAEKDTAPVVR
jgi:hypothetical protein